MSVKIDREMTLSAQEIYMAMKMRMKRFRMTFGALHAANDELKKRGSGSALSGLPDGILPPELLSSMRHKEQDSLVSTCSRLRSEFDAYEKLLLDILKIGREMVESLEAVNEVMR